MNHISAPVMCLASSLLFAGFISGCQPGASSLVSEAAAGTVSGTISDAIYVQTRSGDMVDLSGLVIWVPFVDSPSVKIDKSQLTLRLLDSTNPSKLFEPMALRSWPARAAYTEYVVTNHNDPTLRVFLGAMYQSADIGLMTALGNTGPINQSTRYSDLRNNFATVSRFFASLLPQDPAQNSALLSQLTSTAPAPQLASEVNSFVIRSSSNSVIVSGAYQDTLQTSFLGQFLELKDAKAAAPELISSYRFRGTVLGPVTVWSTDKDGNSWISRGVASGLQSPWTTTSEGAASGFGGTEASRNQAIASSSTPSSTPSSALDSHPIQDVEEWLDDNADVFSTATLDAAGSAASPVVATPSITGQGKPSVNQADSGASSDSSKAADDAKGG